MLNDIPSQRTGREHRDVAHEGGQLAGPDAPADHLVSPDEEHRRQAEVRQESISGV